MNEPVTRYDLQPGDVLTGPVGEEWGTIREVGEWYVKVERTANDMWLVPISRITRNKYGELIYA